MRPQTVFRLIFVAEVCLSVQLFLHFIYILCSSAQMYSEFYLFRTHAFFNIPKLCSTKRHKRSFLAYCIIDFLKLGHIFHNISAHHIIVTSIPLGGNFFRQSFHRICLTIKFVFYAMGTIITF